MEVDAPGEEKISRSGDAEEGRRGGSLPGDPAPDEGDTLATSPDDKTLWSNAWRVWLSIGTTATIPPETVNTADVYIPSQPFLTALIQIFPALYAHIKTRFVASDLQKLSTVLQRALAVPVHGDSSPFIMPVGDVGLTTLQDAILGAVNVLQKVSYVFLFFCF